jgi:hypothetical protein
MPLATLAYGNLAIVRTSLCVAGLLCLAARKAGWARKHDAWTARLYQIKPLPDRLDNDQKT